MDKSTGTFRMLTWNEQTDETTDGLKLTRVRATMAYEGAIAGEGEVEFLMHSPDGLVTQFLGFERIAGTVEGRTGSVVVRHVGTFAEGTARSRWTVVPNSGRDGLTGLRGEGSYGDGAEEGGRAPYTFVGVFDGDAP